MEDRETGSTGLRRAEAYVVEQITKAGLIPAGTDGFYQCVKFTQRQIDEKNYAAALVREDHAEPLVLGENAYFSIRSDLGPEEITAPLVFVGNGLKSPRKILMNSQASTSSAKSLSMFLVGPPTFPDRFRQLSLPSKRTGRL